MYGQDYMEWVEEQRQRDAEVLRREVPSKRFEHLDWPQLTTEQLDGLFG